ncbi:hydroxypyruvate reductase [Nasonia vitripennis]|uniref:D-3-phosphoglycerate dehydrogenase n=1 Tax=Nasonia vitripennis TaxID=7425 RepID=A0A7M7G255_NASVI|nr:hydroxypyruvate reductase [Nasonia vitripennis]
MSVNLRSVLVSDPVDERCAALLTSHGVPVTTKYKLSKEELINELQKHDGLIVRSETKVTADVIAASPNLKLVGRAGTGVDNIDIPAATRNGILVLNTPGGNSVSACELTCAVISALARNVVQAGQSMKEGRWDRKLYAGRELSGKALGVVGFGRIGREVAHRMKAFGMEIIAYDPFFTKEQAAQIGVTKGELEDIWKNADYITVHTPLIPQTKNLINATTLAKCKKGVYIVNVARGGIVDEEALLHSINAGHVAGAALDVFIEEPPKNPVTLELIKHPKVVATPHLGASTAEAQTRVAIEIAEQFLAISGKSDKYSVTGIVNAPVMAAAANPDNAAWIELAKRLGKVAGKFVANQGQVVVESRTTGPDTASKKFVHTALNVGLLANRVNSGLNLVNAPNLAKELGITVNEGHENVGQNAIVVKAGGHVVQGTVVGNATLLVSIDDSVFVDGVHLQDNISLYKAKSAQDLAQVVAAHVAKGVAINNVSIAGNWIIVQTNKPVSLAVDGVESY